MLNNVIIVMFIVIIIIIIFYLLNIFEERLGRAHRISSGLSGCTAPRPRLGHAAGVPPSECGHQVHALKENIMLNYKFNSKQERLLEEG